MKSQGYVGLVESRVVKSSIHVEELIKDSDSPVGYPQTNPGALRLSPEVGSPTD